MRRTSIITTLFLVLVIIGLVVALVVTNLPPKQEVTDPNNEQIVGEENVGEEEGIETPTYLALDSDLAKDMTKMLKPVPYTMTEGRDYFYVTKDGEITIEDFTDKEKLETAYAYGGRALDEEGTIEKEGFTYVCKMKKSDLDNIMLKIFGNTDYTPQDFYVYKYFSDDETFYGGGRGGGGYVSQPIIGTYKVEEYSDRYEVYQKYLFLEVSNILDENNHLDAYLVEILEWGAHGANKLGQYKTEETTYWKNTQTLEQFVADVEMKAFTPDGITSEESFKLLSKYYDQATEYKHTFMKNEDGTFYWYRSEIIK